MQDDAKQFLSRRIAERTRPTWEKPDPEHTFRGRLDGTRSRLDEVVYEDEWVFAFRHRIDPTRTTWWDVHVVIIPKRWIPTVLDFDLGNVEIWHKLISGIQTVAKILGLYERGFVIRFGVLPPYQHTEHVHVHILSGKHEAPHHGQQLETPDVE